MEAKVLVSGVLVVVMGWHRRVREVPMMLLAAGDMSWIMLNVY